MRSDREIRKLAADDITNLTDEEHRRWDKYLRPGASDASKYAYLSERSGRGKAMGGRIHRGRPAEQSAEKAR
jgi:hypothetical protein